MKFGKIFLVLLLFTYTLLVFVRLAVILPSLLTGGTKFSDIAWSDILTLDVKFGFGFTDKKVIPFYAGIILIIPLFFAWLIFKRKLKLSK